MPYERRGEELLPRRSFVRRVLRSVAIAGGVVLVSLALGTIGYHAVAGLPWIDSLHNASMILTGMGPVDPMRTDAAKLFASAYAIFSGVVFLTTVGLVLAPLVHRFLHRFHLETDEEADDEGPGRSPGA